MRKEDLENFISKSFIYTLDDPGEVLLINLGLIATVHVQDGDSVSAT